MRPVASAPQARLPVEEAAAASDAKVQPPGGGGGGVGAFGAAAGGGGGGVGREEALPPEAAGVALDAVAEPQQAVAAEGLPDVAGAAAGGRRRSAGAFGAAAGGGAPFGGASFLAPGAAFFPGLRHDERCGLRMRCGGRELRRRQGSRGEQQDAKVCHDVLGPRNRPDSNGAAFIGMSVGRLNG